MRSIAGMCFAVAAAIFCLGAVTQSGVRADGITIRGWLADEDCARGRANSGVYTATNPDCARECVAKGARIVLIVPEQKQILVIANPETAKSNVGNYVEVLGSVDPKAKMLRVDSLKMLEEGHAQCDVRPKKESK